MILVTRLNGAALALNPDLVERISENPDTTIFLVDGSSHLVVESMAEVIDAIHDARAEVLARAAAKRDDQLLTIAASAELDAHDRHAGAPRPGRAAVAHD